MKALFWAVVGVAISVAPTLGVNIQRSSAKKIHEVVVGKSRPVSKVITLLKDMLNQLENEAEEDEETYDKVACWCETNNKEKTKAIAEAESKIADLSTQVEDLTASSARLNTEIANLGKEVAANQEALDKATAIRKRQLAEFNAEEKDLLESISSLKAAIAVLAKHRGGFLLQYSHDSMAGIADTLKKAMEKHTPLLHGVLTTSEKTAVLSFIQSSGDSFDATPTFKQSYAPQSGEMFGILQQMKETFEANLSGAQKDEMTDQEAFEDLKAAKDEEISAGQAQVDSKTQELAETDEGLARTKEDISDTRNSLATDEKFLLMLKEKCKMTDEEWEHRQQTRHLEMEAVTKALSILSGDDAHDLFSRTFSASFLQKESSGESSARTEASRLLLGVADKFHVPRLSTLAYQVRLDAFTRVKKAIDDMVEQLLSEKRDEIKHKDYCIKALDSNGKQIKEEQRRKRDLTAKLNSLELNIQTLTDALEGLKAQIAEMQVQLKRAGENRERENKDFQVTVADQRQTQQLLQAAMNALSEFYGKAGATVALVQGQEPSGPPPPAGFEVYKRSAGSGGVMRLIQRIVDDAKSVEVETIRSEEDAQKAYEDFVKETNASSEAKSKEIVNKSDLKAKVEADLVEETETKEAVLLELEQLSNTADQIHKSCDYVLQNFGSRQSARDEEVEALRQAKAILTGAQFE